MKEVKEFLNRYEVVNNLENIEKEIKEASNTVSDAMGNLNKED